ncbi:MAG: hypothetical protein JWQ11_4481 [Rhizobacter sp.]|nr:hypothetical protein [Rhizobacter sp.]
MTSSIDRDSSAVARADRGGVVDTSLGRADDAGLGSAEGAPQGTAEGEVVSVSASATALAGRFIVSAGATHFISDARGSAGGPGEAVNAGQLLLSALASCGLALIQKQAAAVGVDVPGASIEVSFRRDAQDGTRYAWIRLVAHLPGLARDMAESLLRYFTDTCPIYNTLARGGPIEARVATDDQPSANRH